MSEQADGVFYCKVMSDPWAKDKSRGYARHNLYSLTGKVFRCKYMYPVEAETVSLVDGVVSKKLCYVIERDEFLRVVPQLEGQVNTKYVCIPREFAIQYTPEQVAADAKQNAIYRQKHPSITHDLGAYRQGRI